MIYYPNYRRELVLKCVKETNVSESTINRYLKKYWIGGKCINALIPNYNLCGGKGKEKTTKENGLKRGRPRNNRDLIGSGININEDIKKIFNVAIKPTASIFKEQNTVNIVTMEETTLCIEGRHDPCIVQRALPVIEAVAAIGITELMNS